MDSVPEHLPSNSSRLIAAAVSLVGSVEEVRRFMKSLEADFSDYCAGRKDPTFAELDRLVTLIIREQGKIIAHNRELLRQVRERQRSFATKR